MGGWLLKGAALASVALLLGACNEGIVDPKGPVGSAQRILLYNATAIMLAIVVPVIVLTVAFAWWFRAGNTKAHYRPDWSYSGPVELVVWSIPVLVILFLGGMTWIATHDLDPPKPLRSDGEPLEVEVVALDWKWLFLYPKEGVASLDRLVIPAGRPVTFRVTSATVMNSFFIPQLGSQIYAMSGMVTRVNLQADAPGRFTGMSANFSGEGFSRMRFETQAVPDAEFRRWVDETKAGEKPLDKAAYNEIAKPGMSEAPRAFGTVADGLFQSIAAGPQPSTPANAPAMSGRGHATGHAHGGARPAAQPGK